MSVKICVKCRVLKIVDRRTRERIVEKKGTLFSTLKLHKQSGLIQSLKL